MRGSAIWYLHALHCLQVTGYLTGQTLFCMCRFIKKVRKCNLTAQGKPSCVFRASSWSRCKPPEKRVDSDSPYLKCSLFIYFPLIVQGPELLHWESSQVPLDRFHSCCLLTLSRFSPAALSSSYNMFTLSIFITICSILWPIRLNYLTLIFTSMVRVSSKYFVTSWNSNIDLSLIKISKPEGWKSRGLHDLASCVNSSRVSTIPML